MKDINGDSGIRNIYVSLNNSQMIIVVTVFVQV